MSETLQSLISNTDQTSADHANDFMDWIDKIIEPEDMHTSQEGNRDQITRELQRYIAEPTSRIDCTKYWETKNYMQYICKKVRYS